MSSEFRGIEALRPPRRRPQPAERRRTALLGLIALAAALLTVVILWLGMTSAMDGGFSVATWLAYLASGVSVVAIILGVASLVLGRGRFWGLVAIVIAVLANPLVLTRLLAWASGLG